MRRPSPATVISLVALVFAMSGTAIAAVTYAANAGAVDGKSAYADGTTLTKAAGDLVATQRKGQDRGRIAGRYLDVADTFGTKFDVVDQATLAPRALVGVAGFGTLTAFCRDQAGAPGRVDPQVTITYANQSAQAVGFFRRVGTAEGIVAPLAPGTTDSFTVSGSRDFEVWAEQAGRNLVIRGVVRQDGRGATGDCVVYGYATDLPTG